MVLAWAGQLTRRPHRIMGGQQVPRIDSVVPPTQPGSRLLEGEPFELVGGYFGGSGTLYWADGTDYAIATKTECTVVIWGSNVITATMPDPAVVGNSGYFFVVRSDGKVSEASALQECLPLIKEVNWTFEDEAHRPDATHVAVGVSFATDSEAAKKTGMYGGLGTCAPSGGVQAYNSVAFADLTEFYAEADIKFILAAASSLDDGDQLGALYVMDGGRIATGTIIANLTAYYDTDTWEIRGRYTSGGGPVYVQGAAFEEATWMVGRIYWKQDTGANDGIVKFWKDDTQIGSTVTDADTDTLAADTFVVAAWDGTITPGTTYTHIDNAKLWGR